MSDVVIKKYSIIRTVISSYSQCSTYIKCNCDYIKIRKRSSNMLAE